MTKKPIKVDHFEFHPVTPDRWEDLETLFGPNGACAGCWCAWWLLTNKEFRESGKEGHKNTLRTLVQQGKEPGIIAYADGIPAGWVTLAPREAYVRLKTSKLLSAVDDQPVWVISCFYIRSGYRRTGMTEKLIQAAIEYARARKIKILEAFPVDVKDKVSPLSIYTGVVSTFQKLGFETVAVRESRPIMRLIL